MIHPVAVGLHHFYSNGIRIIYAFEIAFPIHSQVNAPWSAAESLSFLCLGITLSVVALFKILLKSMASYCHFDAGNPDSCLFQIFLKHLKLAFKSGFDSLTLCCKLRAYAAVLAGKIKRHITQTCRMKHHLKAAHIFFYISLYLISHLIQYLTRIGNIS